MNALYQRLKELSKSDFEILIDQLLQARYPTAQITRVNGSGGDKGVDSYSGKLGGRVAIWQDKHFPDGIGKVQKKQIIESIEVAFAKNQPFQWTLCVPIDLNPSEREWFDNNISAPYGIKSKIDVMQASHIIRHLLNYRRIREVFFPDAVLDMANLKQLIMNTETLQPREKSKLGIEYVTQFVDSLERQDERLRYEVTIGASFSPSGPNQMPGLLASVFDGEKRIDIFARDPQALRDDPIGMLVRLSRDAERKLDNVFKTGRGASFEGEDILRVEMPPMINNLVGGGSLTRFELQPSITQNMRMIPARVVCGSAGLSVTYDYVPFRIKYLGTEEVTFISEGNIPLTFIVKASLKGDDQCTVVLESQYEGFSFKAIQKAIEFADLLMQGSSFEMINLDTSQAIIQLQSQRSDVANSIDVELREFIQDSITVSEYLSADLYYPHNAPTAEDYETLQILKQMATGENFEVSKIRFSMVKDTSISNQYENLLEFGEARSALFDTQPEQRIKVLFGEPINTGRMLLQIDQLKLENATATRKAYKSAKNGDLVEIFATGPSKARYLKNLD